MGSRRFALAKFLSKDPHGGNSSSGSTTAASRRHMTKAGGGGEVGPPCSRSGVQPRQDHEGTAQEEGGASNAATTGLPAKARLPQGGSRPLQRLRQLRLFGLPPPPLSCSPNRPPHRKGYAVLGEPRPSLAHLGLQPVPRQKAQPSCWGFPLGRRNQTPSLPPLGRSASCPANPGWGHSGHRLQAHSWLPARLFPPPAPSSRGPVNKQHSPGGSGYTVQTGRPDTERGQEGTRRTPWSRSSTLLPPTRLAELRARPPGKQQQQQASSAGIPPRGTCLPALLCRVQPMHSTAPGHP